MYLLSFRSLFRVHDHVGGRVESEPYCLDWVFLVQFQETPSAGRHCGHRAGRRPRPGPGAESVPTPCPPAGCAREVAYGNDQEPRLRIVVLAVFEERKGGAGREAAYRADTGVDFLVRFQRLQLAFGQAFAMLARRVGVGAGDIVAAQFDLACGLDVHQAQTPFTFAF
jgi:hypothetical protein